MKGRLHEASLALMHRAFAIEQAGAEKLLGDVPPSALNKRAVMSDENFMNVFRMAEEHSAFRAKPEGHHVPVLAPGTAQKAQHIAAEGEEMGAGKARPWAWRITGGYHGRSFCCGTGYRQRLVQLYGPYDSNIHYWPPYVLHSVGFFAWVRNLRRRDKTLPGGLCDLLLP